MAVDENRPEVSGAPTAEDTPDWTTWLRSRLERVVTTEKKGTESGLEASTSSSGVEAPPAPPASSPDDGRDAAVAALTDKVDALVEATTAYRALIEEQGATSRRLAEWMQELATTQADDERWAVAVGRVVGEFDEERREAGGGAETALATLSERVERIEAGLEQISTELAGLRLGLSRPPTEPLAFGEAQLQAIAARIAAALAARSGSAPPPAEPEAAPGPLAAEQPDNGAEPVRRRPRRTSPLRATAPPPAGHTTRGG